MTGRARRPVRLALWPLTAGGLEHGQRGTQRGGRRPAARWVQARAKPKHKPCSLCLADLPLESARDPMQQKLSALESHTALHVSCHVLAVIYGLKVFEQLPLVERLDSCSNCFHMFIARAFSRLASARYFPTFFEHVLVKHKNSVMKEVLYCWTRKSMLVEPKRCRSD